MWFFQKVYFPININKNETNETNKIFFGFLDPKRIDLGP